MCTSHRDSLIRLLPRVTYVWHSGSFREPGVTYVWHCWLLIHICVQIDYQLFVHRLL